ncbi:phage tail tube protein [Desulfovibrio inopinatus]|uniref:phage tail tube protein n=1 Tax=Desulfovibrio inopinatus TaxID=102109 RepID=UPI00040DC8D3|nr:phage tail tube protein [Desulfovibrio inopinatus]
MALDVLGGIDATTILDFENEYGVSPGTVNGIQMPFKSNEISAEVAQGEDTTLNGRRDPVEPYDERLDVKGKIAVPMDVYAYGNWLRAGFGIPTKTGTGPYIYTFKVKGLTMPSFLVETGIGGTEYYLYNGCRMSNLSCQVGTQGELTSNIDIVGRDEGYSQAAYDATPTEYTYLPYQNSNATVFMGGVEVGICADISLNIGFGLDEDMFAIGGGGKRADAKPGKMAVTGNLTTFFTNSDNYILGRDKVETSLELRWVRGAHELSVLFPEMQLQRKSPAVTGPKGIRYQQTFNAYYGDDVNNSSVVWTVTNDTDALYGTA